MGYIEELNTVFRSLILTALNINEQENKPFVRFSYPAYGQPDWGFEDNVCFVFITPVTSDVERQRNHYISGANYKEYFLRQISVHMTFYGSSSWDYAQQLRDALFSEAITQSLFASNIGLVSDVGAPERVPELFNDRWWERADLVADFYVKTEGVRDIQAFDDFRLNINFDK